MITKGLNDRDHSRHIDDLSPTKTSVSPPATLPETAGGVGEVVKVEENTWKALDRISQEDHINIEPLASLLRQSVVRAAHTPRTPSGGRTMAVEFGENAYGGFHEDKNEIDCYLLALEARWLRKESSYSGNAKALNDLARVGSELLRAEQSFIREHGLSVFLRDLGYFTD
jgi:hypothetical protein